jgi:formate-dependent nitrite reductase membrane component NrfD
MKAVQVLTFITFILVLSMEYSFWPQAIVPTLFIVSALGLLIMVVTLAAAIKYRPK